MFKEPVSRSMISHAGEIKTFKTTKPDLDNLISPLMSSFEGVVYSKRAKIVEYSNVAKSWGEHDFVAVELTWFQNKVFRIQTGLKKVHVNMKSLLRERIE